MTDTYLMIDRAFYGPELISTAQSMGAKAVGGYAFDHFLQDVNGFCAGWTPEAVAAIYNAGIDFHPIFVFRDGETPPTPDQCVGILKALGVHEGAWCHGDYESGAYQTPAQAQGLTSALKAAGYRSAPYGTQGTLVQGYLSGADGAWVAEYLGLPWDSANVQLVNVPNVGAWDYIGWQYANSNDVNGVTVDVSIANFPIGGVLAATATEEHMSPEFKRAFAIVCGLLATGQYPSEQAVESWAGFIADDGTGAEKLLQTLRAAPPAGTGEYEIERLAAVKGVPPHSHSGSVSVS